MSSLHTPVYRLFLIIGGMLAGAVSLFGFTPTEDGIFAVFRTNHGTFAARLYYEDVPQTVANFVGLAEGSRYHLDAPSGQVRAEPYYDGIIFHRVIKDFMIQAGSPNGQGTDGPGYTIADEIRTNRIHAGPGFLSMAKATMPNSGGSQFFITLAATSRLDGLHTVFGEIVSGMEVVQAIGNVQVGGNDRPISPVIIENLEILRRGAATVAFDVNQNDLPRVEPVNLQTDNSGEVRFNRDPLGEYYFSGSNDLATWAPISPLANSDSDTSWNLAAQVQGGGSQFVTAGVIAPAAFPSVTGRRLVLDLPDLGQLDLNFTGDSTGTFNYAGNAGEITAYEWLEVGRTPQVFAQFSTLLPMQIYLQERDQNSGAVFVRVLRSLVQAGSDFNVTGTYQWQ